MIDFNLRDHYPYLLVQISHNVDAMLDIEEVQNLIDDLNELKISLENFLTYKPLQTIEKKGGRP